MTLKASHFSLAFRQNQEMKFFAIFQLALVNSQNAQFRLQSQLEHFANKTDDSAVARNSRMIRVMDFQYGCHCKFDTSLEEMGAGKAVDEVDVVCRHYKECLKVSYI